MTYQCENCGQAALETDVICWHCGHALPRQQNKAADETAVSPPSAPSLSASLSLPLPSIAAYGGLTLIIIIALLWVMQALGQQPQVVQSLGDTLPPGWTAVTDTNREFTLNLPAQWAVWDRSNPQQEEGFITMLRQNEQYQTALAPYDTAADDRQLLLLAQTDQAETAVPAFIMITRSQKISQFTPEQMTRLLEAGPASLELQRANLEVSINGREQITYITAMPYQDQPLRCHHLFYKDTPDSYLITGCVSQDGYATYTNLLHNVLVSFQPLLR